MLARPTRGAWRIFIRTILVPVYRVGFFARRTTGRVLLPAKHRAIYLVSNRYAIHAAVIAIAAITSGVNLSGSEVQAESFGKDSLLYSLVSEEDNSVVEVIAAANLREPQTSSYMDDPSVDASSLHIDLNYVGEDYVTTSVGTLSTPTLLGSNASVAPRTEIERYVVQDGDTLGGVAERFGLSLSTILWANDLTFRSTIRAGKELEILPEDGVMYTVKSGDTLTKIVSRYGGDVEKILEANAFESADDLVVGKDIFIPGGQPPAVTAPVRVAPLGSIFTAPSGNIPPVTTPAAPRGSAGGSGTWVWPTDWRVITQHYGWKHTGVDIDGDFTTQSYAAADGVVIYSGWRNGYGYTVEIDHGNGIVTRYAHHSKNYVSKGDVVTAGQAIAQTGTTGRSTGTHIHFEVIKNGKFQNPLDYIR